MTALRTLAFGEDSVWGTAWVSAPAGAALAALGAGPESTVVSEVGLSDSNADPSGEWRLDGEGVTLVVSPAGELVDVNTAGKDGIEGWHQLVRVSGRLGRGGGPHEVECLGLRSSWSDALDLAKFASIRAVSAWFDPDEAYALTAFRPRKAKAHDGDAVAAAAITPDGVPAVEDPRLSTTYARDGWPARAGLELWLAGDSESDQQYPRRASGEAVGARAQTLAGDFEVQAEPFRWQSRGREGAGMYVLARRR
jgi:hypothetical protein